MSQFDISIVIPHHKESEEIVKPLLSSIDSQIGINFDRIEILLCNDAPDYIIKKFSRYTNLKNIRNISVPGEGNPGISRQFGIDNAKGDYILFCDADDMLYTPTIIYDLISKIYDKENPFDLACMNFIEEVRTPDGGTVFVPHSHDFTWMFSKLYSRKFLVERNIRFHPDLKVHEDSYFNAVLRACNPRIVFTEYYSYVWRFNPNSITRNSNGEYTFNSLVTFIESIELATEECIRRNSGDIVDSILQLQAYIYYTLQTDHWRTEEVQKWVGDVEDRLIKFILKFKPYLDNVEQGRLFYHLNQEHIRHLDKGLSVVTETWFQFLSRIISSYEERNFVEAEDPVNETPSNQD